MTSEQFCYWLQGFLELRCSSDPLTIEQVEMIQKHLALVLTNVTNVTSESFIDKILAAEGIRRVVPIDGHGTRYC